MDLSSSELIKECEKMGLTPGENTALNWKSLYGHLAAFENNIAQPATQKPEVDKVQ